MDNNYNYNNHQIINNNVKPDSKDTVSMVLGIISLVIFVVAAVILGLSPAFLGEDITYYM